jgi:L-seryl-tRNA(Ser) seleniumtransferase
VALALGGRGAARIIARLRTGEPAVVGRMEDGVALLDLRSVAPDQDGALLDALLAAAAAGHR